MARSLSKKTLQKNLENIIDNSTSLNFLPIVTGNDVQINAYTINEKFDGYSVRHTKQDKIVAVTSTKSAALAFVTNRLRKGTQENNIKILDYVIAKNKIDEIFYKQTIRKTKNKQQKFATQTQLQIAQQDIHMARQELYGIIFDF